MSLALGLDVGAHDTGGDGACATAMGVAPYPEMGATLIFLRIVIPTTCYGASQTIIGLRTPLCKTRRAPWPKVSAGAAFRGFRGEVVGSPRGRRNLAAWKA